MEINVNLEVGPFYKVTYMDGTQIQFQVIGGPEVNVNIQGSETNSTNLKSLLHNFSKIERVND